MNTEEHNDPTWDLLKTRSNPPVRPDFVANVLSAIQSVPQDQPTVDAKIVAFPKTFWKGLGSIAAAAVVVVGLYFSLRTPAVDTTVVVAPSVELPTLDIVLPDLVDDTLEQELTAVQDMHAMITVDSPDQLNDAQLIALLN